MILNNLDIKKAVEKGDIVISDFKESRLNPNSYNLRLGSTLYGFYSNTLLDMKLDTKPDVELTLDPIKPTVLYPDMFYLGHTLEYTAISKYVPMIEGRSSVARLGMGIHLTAGFGDIGFHGTWTLEIQTSTRLKVYSEVEICQIYFHKIDLNGSRYSGKYTNQTIKPQTSRMHCDFK